MGPGRKVAPFVLLFLIDYCRGAAAATSKIEIGFKNLDPYTDQNWHRFLQVQENCNDQQVPPVITGTNCTNPVSCTGSCCANNGVCSNANINTCRYGDVWGETGRIPLSLDCIRS